MLELHNSSQHAKCSMLKLPADQVTCMDGCTQLTMPVVENIDPKWGGLPEPGMMVFTELGSVQFSS